MAQSREVEYVHRFDGGLNLTDQTQNLAENESPDALNVDFGVRGGFTLRGGFQSIADNQMLQDAKFIGQFYTGAQQTVLIRGATGALIEWDGSSLTDTGNTLTDEAGERVRAAGFSVPGTSANGQVYFANCWALSAQKMYKWDGTTFTTMTHSFNDDYLTPSGLSGNIPKARHIASWNGFMWVGDTEEGVTRYPTRLRFSHLGAPEDWAADDWFSIGDDSGDPITTLVPFGDRLVVFKRNSVWQVMGYDRDTWVLEQLSNASGTCTCGAWAVNSSVLYWFSTDGQLMAFNRQGVKPLSEPINWWSEIGKIQHGGAHRMMWHDNRVWMLLEAGAGEGVNKWMFIYDAMSKTFTRYDRDYTELINWIKTGDDGDPLFMAPAAYLTDASDGAFLTDAADGGNLVLANEITRWDRSYTTDTTAESVERIDGYYRTGWLRAGETATRKRWKRPRVTAAAKGNATIRVDSYHDFDDLDIARTHDFQISVDSGSTTWGTALWGSGVWFKASDEYYQFARLGSSGTARAVSYKFSSPDNTSRWWVDSVAVPFRRKQVK